MNTMLNTFYLWAKDIMSALPPGVQAELTVGPTSDNPSARIDFDAPARLGRITCWDSGDFYAEIIDAASGDGVLEERGEYASAIGLTLFLQVFLPKLSAPLG